MGLVLASTGFGNSRVSVNTIALFRFGVAPQAQVNKRTAGSIPCGKNKARPYRGPVSIYHLAPGDLSMLRFLVVLIPSLLLACSQDRPAPTAPAGKAADFDDLFAVFLLGGQPTEPSSDTTDSEQVVTDADFSITIYWDTDTTYPDHCIQGIEDAVARWEDIFTSGLQDAPLGIPSKDQYGVPVLEYPSIIPDNEVIDDLAIIVRLNKHPNTRGSAYAVLGTVRSEEHYSQNIGVPVFGYIHMQDVLGGYTRYEKDNEYGYEVDDEGLPIEAGQRALHVKWEYQLFRRTAFHEIGHVLGLAPYDEFHAELSYGAGRFYGPNAVAAWQEAVPSELIRDYVPITWFHWGSQLDEFDSETHSWHYESGDLDWINTNSCMSNAIINHNHLFDKPVWEYEDEFKSTNIFTDLDAGALIDLGYPVDMSKADPLVVRIFKAPGGKANTHTLLMCAGVQVADGPKSIGGQQADYGAIEAAVSEN